jgi:ABC-type transport system involved in cytochrome c biogenesis permease subunit
MTVRDLMQLADQHPLLVMAVFAAPPAVACLSGFLHGKGNGGRSPWKYLYSVMVYLACVPGLFAAVATGYALFFGKENLLDASIVGFFVPVVSMVATLVLIRKNVPFDQVPGFDRLSGLMVMIGACFVIALAIDKTRIWLFFGGSIEKLFLLALAIFALLKWGSYMLFRKKDEPKIPMPKPPLSQ